MNEFQTAEITYKHKLLTWKGLRIWVVIYMMVGKAYIASYDERDLIYNNRHRPQLEQQIETKNQNEEAT